MPYGRIFNTDMKAHHVWIRELPEKDQVEGLYLVKKKEKGVTRKGDPFFTIKLADRTGEIEAKIWENATRLGTKFVEGDVVKIKAMVSYYKDQIQLTIVELEPWKGEVDRSIFMESTQNDISQMVTSLKAIIKRVENPDLKKLCCRFLSDTEFMERFKSAPAAKHFHHNYLGGLLEHTLSVCQLAQMVSSHYAELNRDLLIAGAFLHDIGKTRELSYDLYIDYTDEGRLVGHLVLGCIMLEEKVAQMKGFPGNLALRLKHLILSHHGEFQFGSPKRPKFKEAFALHLIDDFDAKMNGLGRFMEKDAKEGPWTEYNRLFERYFLKGDMEPVLENKSTGEGPEDKQEKLF